MEVRDDIKCGRIGVRDDKTWLIKSFNQHFFNSDGHKKQCSLVYE